MEEKEFQLGLEKQGIIINNDVLRQFYIYFAFLIDYNKKVNLTSITDRKEVYLKHFYDSLTVLFTHPIDLCSSLCDVGSGAGFPGIPLKLVRPDISLTIIESSGKRAMFLKELSRRLNIKDIKLIQGRAEEVEADNREKYDIVTARAVARLNILSELCIPLVKINGWFIALKGQSGVEESKEAEKGIEELGCRLHKTQKFSFPRDQGIRQLLIYKKFKHTPPKYPRNYSQIKNKPL